MLSSTWLFNALCLYQTTYNYIKPNEHLKWENAGERERLIGWDRQKKSERDRQNMGKEFPPRMS